MTDKNSHVHGVSTTIEYKITAFSKWKTKQTKFMAHLWTGHFQTKGIGQEKRVEKIFITLTKTKRNQLMRAEGLVGHRTLGAALPTPAWDGCVRTRFKN